MPVCCGKVVKDSNKPSPNNPFERLNSIRDRIERLDFELAAIELSGARSDNLARLAPVAPRRLTANPVRPGREQR